MAGHTLTAKLVDSLYTEAMLLADETRGYFEDLGVAQRAVLPPRQRIAFACEALTGTTRLMQLIAWLLTGKAVAAGEMAEADGPAPHRRLGDAPPLDRASIAFLPAEARRLLEAGADLYERVRRLDAGTEATEPAASPARSLLQRLERSI